MKIGFDAKRLYNNGTGLGNHSRTTIDILTEYYPENAYLLYTPRVNSRWSEYLKKEHCRTFLPNGLIKGSFWRTFRLAADAQSDGVNIFHGLSNELPVGLKCPSVVTIHDVAFKTFPDMYHWTDRQIYDLKWRYAISRADRIIAISECTKRDIIRYYGVDETKIDVVYQPVAPSYYSPPAPKWGLPYMLYVGSINSRKNLLGIVKAIELLPKDLQIPLVVIGDGRGYKKKVQEYVAASGLEKLIIFRGSQADQDTLQTLYQNAKAFIYPSFYEGFGLPVVEALLSECPVITSNISSLPEAGGPYSLKADPNDIKDIASQIEKVLTDTAFCEQMKTEGRQWALDTLHPKFLAEKLMDVYRKRPHKHD